LSLGSAAKRVYSDQPSAPKVDTNRIKSRKKLAAGFGPKPNPLSRGFPPSKPVWSAGCIAHVCGRREERERAMANHKKTALARHSALVVVASFASPPAFLLLLPSPPFYRCQRNWLKSLKALVRNVHDRVRFPKKLLAPGR